MSRHEGVSCDNCLTSNFREIRFKCLICYDYDLCENCHGNNVSTSRHSSSHPMQCILTRHDFDLYYGGEGITMDNPPALTCPLCGKQGLTEVNLQEHVNAQHLDNSVEVVCPICAAIPTGDPNHVTDDFATHLAIEHNNTHRGIDDQLGGRHMRRMFYPGRSIRGARAQRSANMNFTSGPNPVGGYNNAASGAASVPQMRDAMDPIAELLSQLSGVRRNAQQLQQTVSTASQLQELQAQLQLERQRASIIRQQLERFPGKMRTQNSNHTTSQAASNQTKTYACTVKATKTESSSTVFGDQDSLLLLSKVYDEDSNGEYGLQNVDTSEQSLFMRELISSLPAVEELYPEMTMISQQPSALARAVPVGCGMFSLVPHQQSVQTDDRRKIDWSEDGAVGISVQSSRISGELESVARSYDTEVEPGVYDSDHPVSNLEGVRELGRNGEICQSCQTPEAISGMKKAPVTRGSPLHQSQYTASATVVSGHVCPQTAHPVSSFPVLVSGVAEQ